MNVFFARIYRGKNICSNALKNIIIFKKKIKKAKKVENTFMQIYFSTSFWVIFVYFELLGKKSYFSFCYMGFFQ